MDAWMDGRMDVWMNRWMDGSMDVCMDGEKMDGWMGVWMGWMDWVPKVRP